MVEIERGYTNPKPATLDAIRDVLEAAGIDFVNHDRDGRAPTQDKRTALMNMIERIEGGTIAPFDYSGLPADLAARTHKRTDRIRASQQPRSDLGA